MEISVISHIKNYFQSFKPIAVISLLLFFTGCSVYTAYQQKIMEMQGLMDDDRASMENTAEKMRPGEISPDWQQPMDELEIDEMAELPDGNVLAGLLKIEPVYGYPDYGPLVSLDPETGEENWRYKRSGNSNHQFNLAMTDPVILVERLDSRGKGSIYAAVDIDSGEELWTVKTDSNHTFTSTPDNNTIFIAETGKRKLSYRSYHTLSGDELWEMTLEDHIDVSSLDFVNGQLLSIGNKTRSLDPSDGNINWTAQIPGGSVTEDNYLLFDDGLVVPGGKSRLNRIGFEGRVEWSTTLPEAPDLLSTGNNLLFAVMQDTSGTSFRVAALSLENGSLQWTANIAGELKSPPLVNKNKVVFTSLVDEKHRKLVFIDIEKGRTARMVDFPAAVETVLGDQLIPYEKHLVVVCETAVAAYSWDKSKWLWRHSILPDNNMKESLKFATNAHVRLFRVQGADDSELNTDEYNRAMRESASQFSLLARAKSRQASTFQRTESGIQSSSRAERIAAHETRKIAIEHSIIAANMEFQWQRTAAGVDMLSTGFNAIANAKENAETRFAQAAIQRS